MNDFFWFPYRIYVLIFFVCTTIVVFFIFLFSKLFSVEKQNLIVYKTCNYWAKACMVAFFIKIKIENEQSISKDKASIFIANHRSYIDAAVTFYAIPKLFKPLGKAELGRIPIFGVVYKSVAIMVDRSNAYKRARSSKLLKRQLLRGISVHLYPEGTFNMSNEPLLPFYDGAFKMAKETQTEIQPYIITGTQQILHRSSWFRVKPGIIKMKYLQVTSIEEINKHSVKSLKEQVFQQMKSALIKEGNW